MILNWFKNVTTKLGKNSNLLFKCLTGILLLAQMAIYAHILSIRSLTADWYTLKIQAVMWLIRCCPTTGGMGSGLLFLTEYQTQYSTTCLQGTRRGEDTLWSGDTFSERCPICPMLKNLWWRDTCHVGKISRGYKGVPRRQVLPYQDIKKS